MAAFREVIKRHGLFCAKDGETVDKTRLTQAGRALKELGIQMIPAYSPQARGRMERSYGTWQGRLPQELRLAGCTVTIHEPLRGERRREKTT